MHPVTAFSHLLVTFIGVLILARAINLFLIFIGRAEEVKRIRDIGDKMIEIQFDRDGLTEQCPIRGFSNFDDCSKCIFYGGCEGFTVYCKIEQMNEKKYKVKEVDNMNRELKIWLNEKPGIGPCISMYFSNNKQCHEGYYDKPMSYMPNIAKLLYRMNGTHKYTFRPFLDGCSFGIVATKITK